VLCIFRRHPTFIPNTPNALPMKPLRILPPALLALLLLLASSENPLPHEQVRIFSEGYTIFAQYRTAE
jgi:hypothetical protein